MSPAPDYQLHQAVVAIQRLRTGNPVSLGSLTRDWFGPWLEFVRDMSSHLQAVIGGAETEAEIPQRMEDYWLGLRGLGSARALVQAVDVDDAEALASGIPTVDQPLASTPAGTPDPPRQGTPQKTKRRANVETPVAFSATPDTPRDIPFGDVFNAILLETLFGDRLRYCEVLGGWLIWTGRAWEPDTLGRVMEFARQTIREYSLKAAAEMDEKLLKYLAGCFMHRRLTAMLAQASTLPTFAVKSSQFDQDPWLLNCANGTIDLHTGTLQPHRQEDWLTKCLDVEYHPEAQAPKWHAFLWRVMGGPGVDDPDHQDEQEKRHARAERLIGFLQRSVGYTLTGITHEDCLFILYGSGRNGKSVFVETCQELLQDYAKTAQMTSFLHTDREVVRNDLADLHGVRFVSAIETTQGARFSEGLIKQLTGGDKVKARFLFHEYFEFLPHFKLFLAFNHKPQIRGTDTAIWERIKLVPFEVFIPEEDRDKELSVHLHEEFEGILAWAVRGCLEWKEKGLQTPDDVKQATQAYRAEMDRLQAFLDEQCEVVEHGKVEASTLYGAYVRWCKMTSEEPMTQTKFGRDLTEKGYAPDRDGRKVWRLGLELVDKPPDPSSTRKDLQ